MCGIAGIISLSNSKINNGKSRVNNMLKAMSYRGPNGSGVWNDEKEKVFLKMFLWGGLLVYKLFHQQKVVHCTLHQ